MHPSDQELMLRYRDGDEAAFGMLYQRHVKSILNFIHRVVMDRDEAEDLCQETFYRMAKSRARYQPRAGFGSWLYRIAANLCYDHLRRQKHRTHSSLSAPIEREHAGQTLELQEILAHPDPNPAEAVEAQEISRYVERAIGALTEDQRIVIVLKNYEGLKLREIAAIMDCPVGTVKSHEYRANQKLRKLLAEYLGKEA
ncbi:MAG: sigma-70 family RNA polymerase sigma factor [Candidatus Poribacteria bacterium]|nr:sigma-70 family RNA polymerase sigma factor [Candidatus Poribacteria bacterium]